MWLKRVPARATILHASGARVRTSGAKSAKPEDRRPPAEDRSGQPEVKRRLRVLRLKVNARHGGRAPPPAPVRREQDS